MSRSDRWRLPAAPFLLGAVLGLLGCCLAGRIVSRRPLFEHFVRFFEPIQPQRGFYPTASELANYVRKTVPRDKRLVIVGGASYFRGTGQNVNELWTLDLQRRLGDRYAVVNYGIDQAGYTSFGAVAFEALAHDYPRIYYVANGSPAAADPADGGELYRYVFWDAYYKGLLAPEVAHAPAVTELRRAELKTTDGLELHLGKLLDAAAYACDLWTYLGYKRFFTVWSDRNPTTPFAARRDYTESFDSGIRARQVQDRANPAMITWNESANLGLAHSGNDAATWASREREWAAMMPDDLRPRCFVVFVRPNPYFMRGFSPEDRERLQDLYRAGARAYASVGYRIVPLEPGKFTIDDYADGGHYVASGGRKIAAAVAERIQAVAAEEDLEARLAGEPPGPIQLSFSGSDVGTAPRELVTFRTPASRSAERLGVFRGPDGRLRLQYRGTDDAAPIHSAPLPEATGPIALTVSMSGLYPARGFAAWKSWLLVADHGQPLWAAPIAAQLDPRAEPEVADGVAVQMLDGSPRAPLSLTDVQGARLDLRLTPAMADGSFPLVTTGGTGRGDVLFVHVTARGGLVFGYDHWNDTGLSSTEIPVGFGRTAALEFEVPALAGRADASQLTVRLGGKTVWSAAARFYPPQPGEVYFGSNPIGATTAAATLEDARFEGVIRPTWTGG